jgi:hypothetical protein
MISIAISMTMAISMAISNITPCEDEELKI